MIGVAGWAILVGLLLAWEGLAVTLRVPGWPSLSDMMRVIVRPVVGRWLLFAVWLWLGWHLFMRGWTFFLAGRGPRTPPPRPSRTTSQLLTQVVLPLTAFYVGWLGMVAAAHRGRPPRRAATAPREAPPTTRQRVRHVAVTATFGYLAFVGLIGAYAAVSGQLATGVLGAAVREGAFLAFAVAVPVYLLATVAGAAWRSRRPDGVE